MDSNLKPHLIEPGVKYFLNSTLQQCKIFKDKYYNFIYNLGIFILFILVIGGVLYYKYKGKMTKEEKESKQREKQEYILSKLKLMHNVTKNKSLYTDLPLWGSNPEVQILNKKIFH
tara:strand:- start:43 stop:390 length:348 start_codon:yes stop_codon:yes gene_type:complete